MSTFGEVFFGPLAHLPRLADDILPLYLHEDLSSGSIQPYEPFMTAAWAPGTMIGSGLIAPPLGWRKRATLLRTVTLPLLSLRCHTLLSIAILFRARQKLSKIIEEPLGAGVVGAPRSKAPHKG